MKFKEEIVVRDSFFFPIVLVAIFFLPVTSAGQFLPGYIETFLEQAAENGTTYDADGLLEHFETLRRRPIDINAASRQQLESLGIFSVFQVENLLEYRLKYGDILSLGELSFVEGFSQQLVQTLAPFITFGRGSEDAAKFQTSGRLRYTPENYCGRVGTSFARFDFNATAQYYKDKFLYSVVAEYKLERLSIIAGDYSPRFGQGLLLWRGFSMNGGLGTGTVVRRSSIFVPYRGTDSSMAFRGIGASVDISNRYGIAAALGSKASGVNFSFKGECFSVGLSGLIDYSVVSDGFRNILGGVSADCIVSLGHLRLFSECAYNKNFAMLAGAIYSHSYNFESSLLLRYYPEDYNATFSGAYSSLSKASNQYGIAFKMMFRPFDRLQLQASADYAFHPGPRFRVPVPSSVAKTILRGDYSLSDKILLYSQWNFAAKSYEQTLKNDIRIGMKVSPMQWLDIQIRGDCCLLFLYDSQRHGYWMEKGFAAFAEATCRGFGGKLAASARLTVYSTDGYPTRIYYYESDLPQSFSVPFYYGEGITGYLMVRYKFGSGSGLCLKLSPKAVRAQLDWTIR